MFSVAVVILLESAAQASPAQRRGTLDATTFGKVDALRTCRGCVDCLAVPSSDVSRTLVLQKLVPRAVSLECCRACERVAEHARSLPAARIGQVLPAFPAQRATVSSATSVVSAPRGAASRTGGRLSRAEPSDEPFGEGSSDATSAEEMSLRAVLARNFDSIEPILQVGTFCWDPSGLPQKLFGEVTGQDVVQGLRAMDAPPGKLVPVSSLSLPMRFPELPPQLVSNVFPYDPGYMVPLYVAKRRGVDLQSVDFVLGGSSLNVLASRRIDRSSSSDLKYLVQKCPTTNTIVIAKSNSYEANHADIGFQFERLMTGRPLAGTVDQRKFESLNLMRVAGYTVLLAAEVDAADNFGLPVEVMSGRPRSLSMKVMFQMLSSGSETLVMTDRRGRLLKGLYTATFEDMVWEHYPADIKFAEMNIAEALETIREAPEIVADAPTELDFDEGSLTLKPCPSGDLLPPASVVEELLGDASDELSNQLPSDEAQEGSLMSQRQAAAAEAEVENAAAASTSAVGLLAAVAGVMLGISACAALVRVGLRPARCWPCDRFGEPVTALGEQYSLRFLVCGG